MVGNVTPLTSKLPDKPKLDTVSSFESVYSVGQTQWWRVNPDQLVRNKGLRIYALMMLDDQVKAVTNFKRDAVVSRGWTLSFDDQSTLAPKEQQRRVDLINDILEAYPGSFTDAINSVATGRNYGFSLVEKVFSPVLLSDGEATGVSSLRYRDPSTFEFVTDAYGTLLEFRQRAGGELVDLDLKDFIYYVHEPQNDPYYGQSDLRAAYRAWYSKDTLIKYWLQFLERFAGGFAVLQAKEATAPRAGTAEYAAMQTMLTNLKGAAGVMVPLGMEFKLEQPPTTAMYQEAITFFDMAIAKSLLVPNLLGVSHTGQTGAYSQSQTQLEAFYWTLAADAKRLESVLNEQLFKPLARYNFDDGEGPCFEFKPLSEERLRWLVTTWAALVTGNTVMTTEEDEAYLRSLLNMPAREADSTPLVTQAQQMAHENAQAQLEIDKQRANAPLVPDQGAKLAALESQLTELRALFTAREAVTVNVSPAPSVGDPSTQHSQLLDGVDITKGQGHVHVHGPQFSDRAAFTRAVQRVAFAVIDRRQAQATDQLVQDAARFVAKAVYRLVGDNGALTKLTDQNPEDISSAAFSGDEVGKLKAIFKRALGNSYLEGAGAARNEVDRAGFRPAAQRTTFADVRNVAAEYLDANGFRIAGNVSDATRSIVQQELLNSVKFGRGVAETRTAIWNRLVSKGMTSAEAARGVETDEGVNAALDALWVDTEAQAAAYLNTLSRTNLFDAFNEGRFAEFTDPALQGFVEALEYSAVLDDRTTDICQALDGTVWDADNPLWDTYRPPNHYNCRSILVAVTQVDVARGEWDGEESGAPEVQPADGFGAGEKL